VTNRGTLTQISVHPQGLVPPQVARPAPAGPSSRAPGQFA